MITTVQLENRGRVGGSVLLLLLLYVTMMIWSTTSFDPARYSCVSDLFGLRYCRNSSNHSFDIFLYILYVLCSAQIICLIPRLAT